MAIELILFRRMLNQAYLTLPYLLPTTPSPLPLALQLITDSPFNDP